MIELGPGVTRPPLAKQQVTYILPIRKSRVEDLAELGSYLEGLSHSVEVVVIDGSPPTVFAANARFWPSCRHVAPAPEHAALNGKVHGVLTGLDCASYDRVVIADEDVRYDATSLQAVVDALDAADVVRPQNYFEPLPWHAAWDTGRSLLNRPFDGDWPGTLAVRRSVLERTGGYNGDVLFENLELVRTVRAAGGTEKAAPAIYVRRLPPTAGHFISQRVRQAYDEFARPQRLALQLAILPVLALMLMSMPRLLLPVVAIVIGLAEYGRRRHGGATVFPLRTSLMSPLWVLERGVCSWLAVRDRLFNGGVRYHGAVLKTAATPIEELRARVQPLCHEASR